MPTKNEKVGISVIGVLLIVIALIAFFYPVYSTYFGVIFSTTYPYREYAMPMVVLGVIVLVVGLALPLKEESKQVEIKTEPHRKWIQQASIKNQMIAVGIIVGVVIVIYIIIRVLAS